MRLIDIDMYITTLCLKKCHYFVLL